MLNKTTKDDNNALYTAITELILYLKGDGTLSSLQNKIGIHRNVLSAIFKVYDGQKTGNRVLTKTETPKEKRLYWEMDSLITIATNLSIRVSDLIRAAEDILDGLPPWFQIRTDRHHRSNDRLEHIFIEALGHLQTVDLFPYAGIIQRERLYHKKNTSNNAKLNRWAETYMDEEVSDLMYYVIPSVFQCETLHGFISECYPIDSKALTSKEAFLIFKNAIEHVRKDLGLEGKIEPKVLFDNRQKFSNAIKDSWDQLKKRRWH